MTWKKKRWQGVRGKRKEDLNKLRRWTAIFGGIKRLRDGDRVSVRYRKKHIIIVIRGGGGGGRGGVRGKKKKT